MCRREMLSQNCSRCNNGKEWKEEYKLVHVKYMDHLLFRNIRPGTVTISEREAVGWLVNTDSSEITILSEKSSCPQPFEKIDHASGLTLVRSCIISISEHAKKDRLTFDGAT